MVTEALAQRGRRGRDSATCRNDVYAPCSDSKTYATDLEAAPPSYGIRVGVTDGVDVGVRFAGALPGLAASGGFDVKLNPLRGPVDFAIAPGMQGYLTRYGRGDTDMQTWVWWAHLPVLLGFNVHRNITVMTTGGVSLSRGASDATFENADNALATNAAWWRVGLALDVRFRHWGLHPEVTVLRSMPSKTPGDATIVTFGIGWMFGAKPVY